MSLCRVFDGCSAKKEEHFVKLLTNLLKIYFFCNTSYFLLSFNTPCYLSLTWLAGSSLFSLIWLTWFSLFSLIWLSFPIPCYLSLTFTIFHYLSLSLTIFHYLSLSFAIFSIFDYTLLYITVFLYFTIIYNFLL